MKKILAGALVVAGFSGHAFAADFAPITPATPVAAPPNWTGLYLGAHIGYGSANQSARSSDLLQPGPVTVDLGSGKFDGGLGGGQIGFRYQSGAVVLGAEGEFSWGDISGSSCSATAFTAITGSPYTCSSKIQSITTATGSLGATFDRALVYLKGGGAWVKEDNNDLYITFPTSSSNNTRSGWTVGGGLEYALSGNWSARLEYDYIKLDDIHAEYVVLPPLVGSYHNDLQTNVHLVKLGLNYKLDWFGAH